MSEHYMTHLSSIAKLEDGWWGPGSKAVPSSVLGVLGKALTLVHDARPIDFGIAPNSGGVDIEISFEPEFYDIEVYETEILWTWCWGSEHTDPAGDVRLSPYTAEDLACLINDLRQRPTLEWLIKQTPGASDD